MIGSKLHSSFFGLVYFLVQLVGISCLQLVVLFSSPLMTKATHVIYSNIFDIGSEAFIEPEVRPPAWGDQVTKPLVGQLVSHNGSHILLVGGSRHPGVVQHGSLSMGGTG